MTTDSSLQTRDEASSPRVHRLADYQPSAFLIEEAQLFFDIHDTHTQVKTILDIRRRPGSETDIPLELNGEALTLQSLQLNGETLSPGDYQVDAHTLTIPDVPNHFRLETVVQIKPHDNKALMGLYASRQNLCTQCESHGFRRITYFLDRPDVMTRFSTAIAADPKRYPYLLSNGNLMETRTLADGRRWVHWKDPSLKPCYLFALVAGDFDVIEDRYKTLTGKTVDIAFYLEKGFSDQAHHAVSALKHAMRWDEETFGREYDLERYMVVAVSDFNMGAMENKGLNIFNTKYILAKPDTATDRDYIHIEAVIGHEYFHNWSGNRVTCRDWFQITLKEGLTVLREQLFTQDQTSDAVARLDEIDVMRTQQFAQDSGPMAHPIRPSTYIEINNFYTVTVYHKGAEVIRMLRTLLTPAGFRKGMDLYFSRHDGQAVTVEQFVQAMADASGRDFTQFKRWYNQAGTPILTITDAYDPARQEYTLTIKQTCPSTPDGSPKEPFHLPLAMGLLDEAGQGLATQLSNESTAQPPDQNRVLELTEPTHTITFIQVPSQPTPALLREFSAPVKVQYAYTDEALARLWQHDRDGFVRYDAMQQYTLRVITDLMNQQLSGTALDKLTVAPAFIETFTQLLLQSSAVSDHYLHARLLTLPSLNYLVTTLPSGSDVGMIHVARQALLRQLAAGSYAALLEVYTAFNSTEAYVYDMRAVGARALKNMCLHYLTVAGEQVDIDRAYFQFQQADNMTDRLAGLSALNDQSVDERTAALAAFYQQFSSEPLVVNKWLTMQASSTLPTTLSAVKRLTQHEAYSALNPNNVYALVVAFGQNMAQFHQVDGSGYVFIADQVLTLDAVNPQVAARVLQPLLLWRQRDNDRAQLMRDQLARLLEQKKLSSDVYELVSKSLV